VVTVFDCSFSAGTETGATATFVDPRDGKRYKTVVMPDGKTWFAQNLNYTKDLTFNAYSYEANGKQFTSCANNGVPAIGSYWCPQLFYVSSAELPIVASGNQAACDTYGALYTWETAMMVDGKYADATKTSTAWDENWVSSNYFPLGTAPGSNNNANKNNARGGTSEKCGGRGICPAGWHVPTDYEWADLLNKVEGNTTYTSQTGEGWWGTAGQKMKTSATFTGTDPGNGSWLDSGARGNNTSGFSAVPAGLREGNGRFMYHRAYFMLAWSSTVGQAPNVYMRRWLFSMTSVQRVHADRCAGLTVRCVRD
jgi:uncharacterized protein (TIGR02145 family)